MSSVSTYCMGKYFYKWFWNNTISLKPSEIQTQLLSSLSLYTQTYVRFLQIPLYQKSKSWDLSPVSSYSWFWDLCQALSQVLYDNDDVGFKSLLYYLQQWSPTFPALQTSGGGGGRRGDGSTEACLAWFRMGHGLVPGCSLGAREPWFTGHIIVHHRKWKRLQVFFQHVIPLCRIRVMNRGL